ncbi:endonuclease/exonuclease/phosphatase family protein [Treponema putidum]|uniref:endonuclease/exonuclease/phosphatase family protein n=1 Tax=Treponema putidum TaxID=221027 RepID=UPI003D8C0B39
MDSPNVYKRRRQRNWNTMKLISWNMNYWQQKDNHDLAWDYLVNTINPDIALLQETVVPELYKEQTVFLESHTCRVQDPIKWGTCVYINKDLLQKSSFKNVTELYVDNVYVDNESINGKQVFAELMFNNNIFTICSLHTNTSPDDIYSIRNHIEQIFNNKIMNDSISKFIIGGDFNADIEMYKGFFLKTFNSIKAQYHECIPKYTQTFFGNNMAERNHYQDDHIFVSKDLSNNIGETFSWNYGKVKQYSDHTILEVELNI